MKILERQYTDESFTNLEDAKRFYGILQELEKDVFLGTDDEYNQFVQDYKNYIDDINNCDSLEELADIWNAHTDQFEDGSSMNVREI